MPRSSIELYAEAQRCQEGAETFKNEPEWYDYFKKLGDLYFKAAGALGLNGEIKPEIENEIKALRWPVLRIVRPAATDGYLLKK